MFNVRPGWDLPGLHNFKPPEEAVPGFRMNADGSTRQAPPKARFVPDVEGISFGPYDGGPASVPTSDGRPSLCPLYGRVGPHCVYQCSPTEWIYYTPILPSEPCRPFSLPGHGTRP